MAAVAIGVAGAAALAYGISQITQPQWRRNVLSSSAAAAADSYAPYAYEAKVDPRTSDPSELKHTTWEGRGESAAWEDMEWQLDCSQSGRGGTPGGCIGVRTPGDGLTPFGGPAPPPLWGEVQDRVVRPLGTREPDSFLEEGIYREAQRDASNELETPPEPGARTRYATHPLDWGGQLQPEEIPYGAHEASDLQFWGPENWDSYRKSKRPAYMDNATNQKDGKEINRPLDDFGSGMWDTERGQIGDSRNWGIGAGEFTARDATPRLMAMNRYGSAVTTRTFERPMFLPPTPGASIGGGNPGVEPEITLGARINRLFSAFHPWKSALPGTRAPPEPADIYLEKSRVLLHDPGIGVAAARKGTLQHGGISVNPVEGGRIRQVDDTLTLPPGMMKPKVAAHGGIDVNPYEGYHYTSRETMEGPEVGRRRQGGNAYLLLGPNEEYRARKVPSDLQEYIPPRGGARTNTYGGEAAHGSMVPNLKSDCAVEVTPTILGRGAPGGLLGKAGIVNLQHNTAIGNRGGDYDDSPIPEQLINLNTPRSVAWQVGGRTQAALDDLFDVLIS